MTVLCQKSLSHIVRADHIKAIRSEIEIALASALDWAGKAHTQLTANDQATMAVANMLFDDVDDAKGKCARTDLKSLPIVDSLARLQKVVQYGTVKDGNAPENINFGDVVRSASPYLHPFILRSHRSFTAIPANGLTTIQTKPVNGTKRLSCFRQMPTCKTLWILILIHMRRPPGL